ncbi:hypothetical protein H920_09987 [Fukomys damarensis]|uniref:Uncharacterized protein n=1 Tax=Fukomys damarensis TaxID=885580 RepID=A0A091DC48_FUKDA|nr:hypothetical protein H920_09987 [Fukomys damarensis]
MKNLMNFEGKGFKGAQGSDRPCWMSFSTTHGREIQMPM